MAIKGSLKEASLADVIQLLALGQKTGCLSISDRHNFGSIYFNRGKICYATIVNRRDRLGDILVKNELITQEQLDAAVEWQGRDRDHKLGEILIDMNAIRKEDLEHYMRLQIEEAVYFLFTWTQGTFNFESDVAPDEQDFQVAINPESLLLEGARRVDEWSLIAKKIPSFDIVLTADTNKIGTTEVKLTAEQEKLLPLIDGERDVAALVEDSGLGEFEVGKALYGLMTAGFVHRSRAQSRRTSDAGDDRVEEHRNLGLAFFRTGMLDESMREFKQVVELRPEEGEAYFYLGMLALKQARWLEAVDWLRKTVEVLGPKPAVLHNLALGLEQSGQLDEADSVYGEASSRARHDMRILMGWGIVALERGEYEVAGGRLDRAREVMGDDVPPAMWFWARSLSAINCDQLDEAENLLKEGLELYPAHSVLRNNLAVLQEAAGRIDECEKNLTRALATEPSLPQLHKNLGDIRYSAGRFDEALEAYERVSKLDPDIGDDIYFKMGNIAYKKSDRKKAAELWNKALEMNPSHELARTNLETMNALVSE